MSNTRTLMVPISIEDEERLKFVANTLYDVGDAMPENHYWGFSVYTMIIPYILKELGHSFVLPQTSLSGPIWNYLDSACSVMVGASQCLDEESHRPNATKVKGVINILNGVQLTALTVISFSALGGPGFAAAFGVGFLLSMDETVRGVRRLVDEEYWLKDSLMQIKKLNELRIMLKDEIKQMEDILEKNGTGRISNWALNRKKERLEQYLVTKTELEEDVIVRTKTMLSRNDGINESRVQEIAGSFLATSDLVDKFDQRLRKTIYDYDINKLKIECNSIQHKKKENKIKQKCETNLIQSSVDSLVWGIAFVGMLLACIPGMQIPALCCIAFASGIYIAKNLPRIASVSQQIFSLTKKGCSSFYNKIHHPASHNKKEVSLDLEDNLDVRRSFSINNRG